MTHPVDSVQSLELSEWVIKKAIGKLSPIKIYQNGRKKQEEVLTCKSKMLYDVLRKSNNLKAANLERG